MRHMPSTSFFDLRLSVLEKAAVAMSPCEQPLDVLARGDQQSFYVHLLESPQSEPPLPVYVSLQPHTISARLLLPTRSMLIPLNRTSRSVWLDVHSLSKVGTMPCDACKLCRCASPPRTRRASARRRPSRQWRAALRVMSQKRLLEAEEVAGVVSRLHAQQAVVVGPVVGLCPVRKVRVREVGVDAAGPPRMHRRPRPRQPAPGVLPVIGVAVS